MEVVQYSRGKHQYMRGITSVHVGDIWRVFSTVEGIPSVLWEDTFSTVGDNSSTCGG